MLLCWIDALYVSFIFIRVSLYSCCVFFPPYCFIRVFEGEENMSSMVDPVNILCSNFNNSCFSHFSFPVKCKFIYCAAQFHVQKLPITSILPHVCPTISDLSSDVGTNTGTLWKLQSHDQHLRLVLFTHFSFEVNLFGISSYMVSLI